MARIRQERETPVKEPTVQNDMPEYGQGRYQEPRCRGFGVLGFDDRPEAKIGGTVIHKNIEDTHGGA